MSINKSEEWFLSSDTETSVFLRVWEEDDGQPRFALQISHGMCDYADRFDGFAQFVCSHGGVVFGNDHLGHGHTKGEGGHFGYWGKRDGEELVMEDMHKVTEIIKARYPGLPVFMLGHSMGSLLARLYAAKYGEGLSGLIMTGTSGTNNVTALIRVLARVGMVFGRAKKPAHLLTYLAFSKYNDRYEDVQTPVDWLTRDRKVVADYCKDPWCTFLFTDRAAYDMANLMDKVSGAGGAGQMPKNLPYLLASGTMDPVGNYTEGVNEVYGLLRAAGAEDVSLKLYEGARHEILNETNRQEVFEDILEWISTRL